MLGSEVLRFDPTIIRINPFGSSMSWLAPQGIGIFSINALVSVLTGSSVSRNSGSFLATIHTPEVIPLARIANGKFAGSLGSARIGSGAGATPHPAICNPRMMFKAKEYASPSSGWYHTSVFSAFALPSNACENSLSSRYRGPWSLLNCPSCSSVSACFVNALDRSVFALASPL